MSSRYDHLSREELLRLLDARDRRDATRFGLVWEADDIERECARNSDFIALDIVPELSCGSAPWRNLIIEGDNFDALRHLRMGYSGQVKCIYIDPPYNTGNRDFVYNDRFVDKEDSWRHSKWSEFMFQRLMLARDLLQEDGVIFVSIDDNEVSALGLILSRVFGEASHLGTMIWKTRQSSDSRNKTGLSTDHEYVFAYGKRIRGTAVDEMKFTNPDEDARGPWRSADMTGLATKDKRPNLHYDLTNPTTEITYPCPLKGWRFDRTTMARLISEKRVLWPNASEGRPRLKKFYRELESKEMGFSSLLEAPYTADGTKDLKQLGFTNEFSFPKPVGLIAQLIDQATGPNDLVLDFFAGSGTTAHAVHKLNAEDGGKRRVILVSSTEATEDAPDKNLCRDICATRVRRVIEGYTPPGGEPMSGLSGDFAYLRTRRIPAERLLEMEHAQVWTTLQLMHQLALTPYAEAPFMWAGDDDEAVMLVPRFRREDTAALQRQIQRSATVTLYSWQPSVVEQHLRAGHVTHLQVPETLTRKFGLGQRGKR